MKKRNLVIAAALAFGVISCGNYYHDLLAEAKGKKANADSPPGKAATPAAGGAW